MIESLILLAIVAVPAGAGALVSFQRLGAVHAAELTLKAGGEGDRPHASPGPRH